jgi:hypothetical protein
MRGPVMRLGKPIEHLQAALRASLAPGPVLEQISTIGRHIGYFGYLAYDALVWVGDEILGASCVTVTGTTGKHYKIHQPES